MRRPSPTTRSPGSPPRPSHCRAAAERLPVSLERAPSSEVLAAYEHCRGVTRASHSSFAAAFWMFPKAKRRALHAIYAFCRLADDIADDPAVRGNRALLLERWREEL